jgi:hypothetical protein
VDDGKKSKTSIFDDLDDSNDDPLFDSSPKKSEPPPAKTKTPVSGPTTLQPVMSLCCGGCGTLRSLAMSCCARSHLAHIHTAPLHFSLRCYVQEARPTAASASKKKKGMSMFDDDEEDAAPVVTSTPPKAVAASPAAKPKASAKPAKKATPEPEEEEEEDQPEEEEEEEEEDDDELDIAKLEERAADTSLSYVALAPSLSHRRRP